MYIDDVVNRANEALYLIGISAAVFLLLLYTVARCRLNEDERVKAARSKSGIVHDRSDHGGTLPFWTAAIGTPKRS
jgi:hypothetical protein